jgi:hypothetical protein
MSESGEYGDSVYEQGDPDEPADLVDPIDSLTGDDPDEPQETGYSPPDRETARLKQRPTPAEEADGPSLDEQLAAEEPDVAEVNGLPDPRAGRLVAPDEGFREDREKDQIAEDIGPAGYASSAEEAAVHVRDEDPPVT